MSGKIVQLRKAKKYRNATRRLAICAGMTSTCGSAPSSSAVSRAALIASITWSGMRSTVSSSCNGSNRLNGGKGLTCSSMSVASPSAGWELDA